MKQSNPYNPNQAVRLLWFFLFFLTPFAALGYVSMYRLKNGDEEALIRVLSILAVSLVVSLACGIAQPVATLV